MDVDGVLTDGIYGNNGQVKAFNVQDGMGNPGAPGRFAGLLRGIRGQSRERGQRTEDNRPPAVLPASGGWRCPAAVRCFTGGAAFIGDDLNDPPAAWWTHGGGGQCCGRGETGGYFRTQAPGGRGAVREVIERIPKTGPGNLVKEVAAGARTAITVI